MPSDFEIGHDARGIVEAEILAELQSIGGERDGQAASRAPRSRRRPTRAAVRSAARRPRSARWPSDRSSAAAGCCRRGWPGSPALRRCGSSNAPRSTPSSNAASPVTGPKLRQARHDKALPRREQPSHQIKPRAMLAACSIAAQSSVASRTVSSDKRIGHPVAHAAHRPRQIPGAGPRGPRRRDRP